MGGILDVCLNVLQGGHLINRANAVVHAEPGPKVQNSFRKENNYEEFLRKYKIPEQIVYQHPSHQLNSYKTSEQVVKQRNYDYQTISVYPQPNEVLTRTRAGIQQNIVDGGYENVKHYLDTHFKLLREDFLAPIREAICTYRESLRNNTNVKLPEFCIYMQARFIQYSVNADCSNKNFGNKLRRQTYKTLNPGNCSQNSDANIKDNFMSGSLLCFSSDNFETTFFGTVVTVYGTENGLINVWLVEEVPFLYNKTYIMLECNNYFSPYYLVLKAIQDFDVHNFPMQKYIVDVLEKRQAPVYLILNSIFTTKYSSFRVLNYSTWPSKKELNLNEMQYEAFKHALTSEFTVIQGPPGTGKTHLGLKIAQTLIENHQIWGNSGPILVIACTNHALDQFLEGLLPYTQEIVRLGYQSKNDSIKKYIFRGSACKRNLPKNLYTNIQKALDYRQKTMQQLEYALLYGRNNCYVQPLKDALKTSNALLYLLWEQLDKHKQAQDSNNICRAVVVGMTTSGAAKNQHLLENLKCRAVIVEEAAEVLESHIVISLTPYCQHLILIGDHQQLRPSTADYTIEKDYHLGISLFERMVRNGISYRTLVEQHRMRPEISRLIAPAIYPYLENHSSVYHFRQIVGIKHNVFFVTHTHPEEEVGSSKRHPYEADYIIALARHLILQGNNPKEITILTMYNSQLEKIKNKQKSNTYHPLQEVHVTTVDNFQGEENQIILLSLVRSNDKGNIGFLAVENRICVALSRAKKGFYMVGNMKILSKKSKIWQKIKDVLVQHEQVGPGLPLTCQRHPFNVTIAQKPQDFSKDGGCNLPCNAYLSCGHDCQLKCHVIDFNHANYKCPKPCKRIVSCGNGHNRKCTKKCGENCNPCLVPVLELLSCGHQATLPCSTKIENYKCLILVETVLGCTHTVKQPCFEVSR